MERLFFKERSGRTVSSEEELQWNLTSQKQKMKIAVVGISRGAGTTFVATSLAFLLASSKFVESCQQGDSSHPNQSKPGNTPRDFSKELSPARVSYVEMRQPHPGEPAVFFGVGLDRRFGGNRFHDFFASPAPAAGGQLDDRGSHQSEAKNQCLSQSTYQPRQNVYPSGQNVYRTAAVPLNLHKGINWVVWRHCQSADAAVDLSHYPLHLLPGEYIITDSPPLETLKLYDLVIGIINPLPAAVYAGADTFECLHDQAVSGLPLLWVVNMDNPEVNHSALKRFLKLKEFQSVPLLNQEMFFKAQYICQLPVELLADSEQMHLENLAKKVIERTR